MKKPSKVVALFTPLIFLAVTMALSGCAGSSGILKSAGLSGKANKEILVRTLSYIKFSSDRDFWCGNNAIVFAHYDRLDILEIPSGRIIRVTEDNSQWPLSCSPDGRWLIYAALNSKVKDRKEGALTDSGIEIPPEWEGIVLDLIRYEVATGEAERFASVTYPGAARWDVISPDGKRVFLGIIHNTPVDMPEPKVEPLWYTNWWGKNGARWFWDSSGVVSYMHNPNTIFVEVFGEDGWSRAFMLGPEVEDNIYRLYVGKDKMIYFQSQPAFSEDGSGPGKVSLYRCAVEKRDLKDVIEERDLKCGKIIERDAFSMDMAVLENGDMLIHHRPSECIYSKPAGRRKARCLVGNYFGKEKFSYLYLIGQSADREWITYLRVHGLKKDLYILRVKED